jgi:hypothetical protein
MFVYIKIMGIIISLTKMIKVIIKLLDLLSFSISKLNNNLILLYTNLYTPITDHIRDNLIFKIQD